MNAPIVWLVLVAGSVACRGSSRDDAQAQPGDDSGDSSGAAAESPAAGPAPMLVGTTWRLAELAGKPAPLGQDGKAAMLELVTEGKRATGFAGCNRMAGTYELSGDSLRLGPLVLTRMACEKGMELEKGYVEALESTRAYSLSPQGLELLGVNGSLARLEAQ